jgi:hypothetical protein
MQTRAAPINLIFPPPIRGRKSISAHQNTGAQFLIPYLDAAKKEAPEPWGAWGRGDEGRACQARPHLDYARPLGRASGASIRPAPRPKNNEGRHSRRPLDDQVLYFS